MGTMVVTRGDALSIYIIIRRQPRFRNQASGDPDRIPGTDRGVRCSDSPIAGGECLLRIRRSFATLQRQQISCLGGLPGFKT